MSMYARDTRDMRIYGPRVRNVPSMIGLLVSEVPNMIGLWFGVPSTIVG